MCQNGGTCKLVFNSTNAVQSRCSCQFGFYGTFCEKCNYILIHYVVNHLSICYADVYIHPFRYTFIIKTYYMNNMFRFSGRFYGCLNIMRQGVNICLHFCLLVICFSVWLAKRCRSFFTFIFCPLSFVSFALTVRSQCAHSTFTLRSDCVHLRSLPHSIRAHRL